MKDPRTAGRTRSSNVSPPAIEQLRAAVAARVGSRQHAVHAQARVIAHIDALAVGRASVSPAASRTGSRGKTQAVPRASILPRASD
jgi:hypothetical protein